jgi:predicted RNA-binding Zn ribbon-like protein
MTAEQTVTARPGLAVDFVNTLEWRGSVATETITQPGELVSWLIGADALSSDAGDQLKRWFEHHVRSAAAVLGDALELRERVYRLLRARALGDAVSPEDLSTLNRALAATPARAKLDGDGSNMAWRIHVRPAAPSILAPVLWSGADLLANPTPNRLRECANERCRWMFIDDSKGGTRRWCSMQACGNRAKAQRHYQRRKQG